MTDEDFEEIIRPLVLLEKAQRDFITSALLGNFENWKNKNEK